MHRAAEFVVNEEDVRILAQKHAKTKPASQPSAAQMHSQAGNKKANQNHGFVQHEGGSEGIHNYQIGTAEFGRDQGYRRGSGNTRTGNSSSYDDIAYCEYHHVNGHSTANCLTLGLKLAAKLAAEGRLTGDLNIKDFEMEESTEQLESEEGEPPKRGRQGDDGPEQSGSRRRINEY